MRTQLFSLFALALLSLAAASATGEGFDFFYFVLQWPGSYCDTDRSCCYPTTGKPAADFGIHGLWPNNADGTWPSNCDPNSEFDPSVISDLRRDLETNWPTLACPSDNGLKFWEHEWEKHGTCAESTLDQHQYFRTALDLKNKLNLLKILADAGIKPDGGFYSTSDIAGALERATGGRQGIECNVDESGNSQLYQIYICVDSSATKIISCPVMPSSSCSEQVEFPSF